jgi:hypothetical protein
MRSETVSREDDKKAPPEIEDFGFHYPLSYVETMAIIVRHSNYQAWPDVGGLNDQDWYLLQDMRRYWQLEDRLQWEADHNWYEEETQEPTDIMRLLDG